MQHLCHPPSPPLPQAKPPLLPSFDLAGIAALIKAGAAKRIICMCGAGISVSAGALLLVLTVEGSENRHAGSGGWAGGESIASAGRPPAASNAS